jgi:hypothetical protein
MILVRAWEPPTRRSRPTIVLRLMALLVAGCMCITLTACTSRSDDGQDAGEGTVRCEHTVSPSAEVPSQVALEAATSGCLHEEGQHTTYETTTVQCVDGRVLHWNEAGWGYDDGTWHPEGSTRWCRYPRGALCLRSVAEYACPRFAGFGRGPAHN